MKPSTDFTKLNVRQRKYLDGLSQGLTRRQALDYAGYSETTRPVSVENSSVKAAFARLIRRAAPAHKIAYRIAEGLDAKETKFFQFEGRVTDQRDVIAWGERRAYAELAAKFGEYSQDSANSSSVAVGVKVIVEHIGRPSDQASAQAK